MGATAKIIASSTTRVVESSIAITMMNQGLALRGRSDFRWTMLMSKLSEEAGSDEVSRHDIHGVAVLRVCGEITHDSELLLVVVVLDQ